MRRPDLKKPVPRRELTNVYWMSWWSFGPMPGFPFTVWSGNTRGSLGGVEQEYFAVVHARDHSSAWSFIQHFFMDEVTRQFCMLKQQGFRAHMEDDSFYLEEDEVPGNASEWAMPLRKLEVDEMLTPASGANREE